MTIENNCVFEALIRIFPNCEREIKEICKQHQDREPLGGEGVYTGPVLDSLQKRGLAEFDTRDVEPVPGFVSHQRFPRLKEEISRLYTELEQGHPLLVRVTDYDIGSGHLEAILPEDGVSRGGMERIVEVLACLLFKGGTIYSVGLPEEVAK